MVRNSEKPTNCFQNYWVAPNVRRDVIRTECITSGVSKERALQREFELHSGITAQKDSIDNCPSLLFIPTFLKYISSGLNKMVAIVRK